MTTEEITKRTYWSAFVTPDLATGYERGVTDDGVERRLHCVGRGHMIDTRIQISFFVTYN